MGEVQPDVRGPTTAGVATGSAVREDGLRDWLTRVGDELGESQLRIVPGASSEADIGAVAEMLDHTAGSPCVLFDAIPGFPAGHRVIVNTNGTIQRQAVTLGLDPSTVSHEALLEFWSTTLHTLEPIPPEETDRGPILENVMRTARRSH